MTASKDSASKKVQAKPQRKSSRLKEQQMPEEKEAGGQEQGEKGNNKPPATMPTQGNKADKNPLDNIADGQDEEDEDAPEDFFLSLQKLADTSKPAPRPTLQMAANNMPTKTDMEIGETIKAFYTAAARKPDELAQLISAMHRQLAKPVAPHNNKPTKACPLWFLFRVGGATTLTIGHAAINLTGTEVTKDDYKDGFLVVHGE